MKKLDIINNVTRSFNKVGFKLKKHSPEIMLVAGVIGVVGSAIMACRATTKVSTILESTKAQVDGVHDTLEDKVFAQKYEEKHGVPYTQEKAKKDLAIIYGLTGLEFVKLYGPSVLLGALSITSILASHDILRKRNLAIAAAYATVDGSFKEYRGRVIERFGKELDRELKYDLKTKEIEETVVNEDGTESTIKKTVQVVNPNMHSEYARFYDDGCLGWEKDAEHNLYFLICQQNYANEKLKANGYLYLNEVYDMLGIPRTRAGQVVGWIYDKEDPIGDNYVDFGIHDMYSDRARAFVNGHERVILLDFNVDGNIWELMK